MRAVILVVRLAVLAFEASPYLRSDAHTVTYFDGRHLFADLNGLANNFMSYTERHGSIAPATIDGVHV